MTQRMLIILVFWSVICSVHSETTTYESTSGLDELTGLSFCGQDDCLNVSDSGSTTESSLDRTDHAYTLATADAAKSTVTGSTPRAVTMASPTTTPIPRQNEEPSPDMNYDERCSCDVVRGTCDINCCCDLDCSETDKSAFSNCIPEPENNYSGLCYNEKFVYSNNTRYKVLQQAKGIFCIARDNFPERLFFTTQKTIYSTSSFNRALKRKRQFTWSSKSGTSIEKLDAAVSYKFGVPIWIYNNKTGTIETLDIPTPLGGMAFCKGRRTARYLEEFENHCPGRIVPRKCDDPLSNLNANSFCENLVFVTSPILVNNTKYEESQPRAFMVVSSTVCDDNWQNCQDTNTLKTAFYDKAIDSCVNVMRAVEYRIFHNSSDGITKAQCRLILGTFRSDQTFEQTFRVTFKWASRNDTTVEGFPRSGFPGYSSGKPIVSGNMKNTIADATPKTPKVNVSNSSKDWLSLPIAGSDGGCSRKTNILFKENLRVQCSLTVDRDLLLREDGCAEVRDLVWSTIFGDMKVNKSDPRQLLTLVSAFGDPSLHKPDDWVPIFMDRPLTEDNLRAPCPRQIAGAQYRVLYSYFGPFSRPQTKIIGLFATVIYKNFECRTKNCQLSVMSSVNFLDVSQQAVNKFAKAPMVKIRLPPDFFYPFSSVGRRIEGSVLFVMIVLCIISTLQ